ncbi:MAG: AarF/ABC1/UbiB kinase family protein, partial [Chloroflexi bacterium]|nr:AarF/ABC1/UbiB kinase family protein [Chloroflexota bacterium]
QKQFADKNLADELAGYKIDWRRYRRTLRFAAWLFARVLFWELILRRLRGERVVKRSRSRRMRGWAREFRLMAAGTGGVMIKLGQFISSRVDILPPEIIEELAGLQDEVPTVPFDLIRQTLHDELGPLDQRFATFNETPVAAASLGQAHRARLPGGEQVIVKVQRPGIRALVNTDLKALGVVAGWAMRLPFIARRANIPALLAEFSAVLWEELDYSHEADHAETFAQMFADNMGVYIPRLYRSHCTPCIVTLEDVTAIKITDYERLEAAGIDRRDVSRRLIYTYLWMVFDQRFYHADPHPGNLFVYPLPPDASPGSGQNPDGQLLLGQPFYLIFVDFGMVGRLTPPIEAGMREALIALTTRDAHRLIAAYQRLGILLPGADTVRLEQASRAAFDRVWGMDLSQIGHMQFSEAVEFGREFSDLIFSMPFQVPQDFLYLTRCVGILVGLCTGLDPAFNPWREVAPFAATLLDDKRIGSVLAGLSPREWLNPQTWRGLLSSDNAEWALETALDLARRSAQIPIMADSVLRRADRGELSVRATLSPEMERQVGRLEHAAYRLTGAITFAGVAISSAILYTNDYQTVGTVGFVVSGLLFLRTVLMVSIR